ncbi:MAG: DNA-damage-inducible protein D [uncultured bacterium (gcode 4)]|uniref:DNA-damage-inducible protein D n=1 Tax=uncultured bacterium (gcode 4) TaxID=1234023 RepID=K1XIE9_9BACT|nr:MAG: DNA-damage-inducible protein D [uncultured bacterium (gcode 4)]
MEQTIVQKLFKSFETIKQIENGVESRRARELAPLLWYSDWRNFLNVITKAKDSCKTAWWLVSDHFGDVNKSINSGKGAIFEVNDILLSRFACYLIAQNGDPKKEEIAFSQAYFAVQTRKQEIIEQKIKEHERLIARRKLTETETHFQNIAYERGVDGIWLSNIRSKWDQALFGGHSTGEMKNKLWIPKNRPLADFLPAVTIKAKDLATEVTNVNMIDKNLQWEKEITKEHIKNNTWVRAYLWDSGIIPEKLPSEEDIKKVERRNIGEMKKIRKR